MTTRDPTARAIEVLRHIVESADGPTSARRIGTETGMPVTTVHRALSSLAATGMLTHNAETQLYELGPALHRMARLVTGRYPLSDLGVPYLRNLTQLTGETSHIGQYDQSRHEMMFVAQAPGSHPLRYVVPLHTWLPLYFGASGLAILAFLDDETQEMLLERARQEHGRNLAELRTRVVQTRTDGYAITHGDRIRGAVGVAAPLWGAAGSVIGDVVLTVPEVQFEVARAEEYARLVMECAQGISAALGAPEVVGPDAPASTGAGASGSKPRTSRKE